MSSRTRSSGPSCCRTGPVITTGTISVLGAAAPQSTGLPSLKLRQNIEWVERETIRRALEGAGGVKKDAAELMGISQRALSVLSGQIPLRLRRAFRAGHLGAARVPSSRSRSRSDPGSSPTSLNFATNWRAVFSSSTCSVRNHWSSVISANALLLKHSS